MIVKKAKRKINWAGKNKYSPTKEKSEKESCEKLDTYPEMWGLSNFEVLNLVRENKK